VSVPPPYGALRSIAGDAAMAILPTPALETVMAQEVAMGRASRHFDLPTQPTVSNDSLPDQKYDDLNRSSC
jgi:hypothetical protein